MGAPIGAEVGLYLDAMRVTLQVGDYVRSASTGRTYLIVKARVQERGIHAGRRQHLRAVIVPEDHPEPDDRVLEFVWYRRNPR